MNLFGGLVTILLGLIISVVAGYFSVVGLGALFAAAFWPVVIMGGSLEAGKIVAASWLKANWKNTAVSRLHKLYLLIATFVLMLVTALGIYGYLAKGHLEQKAPLATVELQMQQIEEKVAQVDAQRNRMREDLDRLDNTISKLLETSKNAKDAQAANRLMTAQKKERDAIAKQIEAKDAEKNALVSSLVPLKTQVSDVSAKLGPLKYVADLFGWQDPNSAVKLVIVMIMFAFDPLAVMLILSGTISLMEWRDQRRARKSEKMREKRVAEWQDENRWSQAEDLGFENYIFTGQTSGGTKVETLPTVDDAEPDDLAYFTEKLDDSLVAERKRIEEEAKAIEEARRQIEEDAKQVSNFLLELEQEKKALEVPKDLVITYPKMMGFQTAWSANVGVPGALAHYPVVVQIESEPPPQKSDRELLVELLEKNKDFLQEVIDMVSQSKAEAEDAIVHPTVSAEPIVAPTPNVGPGRKPGWLDRPWFRDDK